MISQPHGWKSAGVKDVENVGLIFEKSFGLFFKFLSPTAFKNCRNRGEGVT